VGTSPSERSAYARAAVLTSWAVTPDKAARVAPGLKAANEDRFLAQIDLLAPGLPEGERRKRAGYLRQAHMVKLAAKSLRVRRLKAAERRAADPNPDEVPTTP
jgi:hypothetical protein